MSSRLGRCHKKFDTLASLFEKVRHYRKFYSVSNLFSYYGCAMLMGSAFSLLYSYTFIFLKEAQSV